MIKRWNTQSLAWKIGIPMGLLYTAVFNLPPNPLHANIVAVVATLFGGALGGAALVAIVSGCRNLMLRAK